MRSTLFWCNLDCYTLSYTSRECVRCTTYRVRKAVLKKMSPLSVASIWLAVKCDNWRDWLTLAFQKGATVEGVHFPVTMPNLWFQLCCCAREEDRKETQLIQPRILHKCLADGFIEYMQGTSTRMDISLFTAFPNVFRGILLVLRERSLWFHHREAHLGSSLSRGMEPVQWVGRGANCRCSI